MNNLHKILSLSTLILLTAACGGGPKSGQEAEEAEINIFPVTIDTDKEYPKKTIQLDSIADISFIYLDTPGKMFLTASSDPVFILDDGGYIVKGFRNNDLWRFDSQGKFLNRIGRTGRGPGEVVHCFEFFLDTLPDGEIRVYLHDGNQLKMLCFDLEGNCLNEWRHSDVVYHYFSPLNDSSLIAIRDIKPYGDRPANPAHLFAALSKEDGHLIRPLGPYTEESYNPMLSIVGSEFFFNDGNSLVANHMGCDTIFTITDSYDFAPRYIFTPALKDADTPRSRCTKYIQIMTDKFESIKCARLVGNTMKTESVEYHEIYVDKRTGELFEVEYKLPGVMTNPLTIRSFLAVLNRKNTACVWFDAMNLKEKYDEGKILHPQLQSIASTLTEDSNQVLMVMEFR